MHKLLLAITFAVFFAYPAYAKIITTYGFSACSSDLRVGETKVLTSGGWAKNSPVRFRKFMRVERRIGALKMQYETPFTIRLEGKVPVSQRKSETEVVRGPVIDCKSGYKASIGNFDGGGPKLPGARKYFSSKQYDDCFQKGICDPSMSKFNYQYKYRGWFRRCRGTDEAKRGFLFVREGREEPTLGALSVIGRGVNLSSSALASTPHNYRKTILIPISSAHLNSKKNIDNQCIYLKVRDNSKSIKEFRVKIRRVK